MILVLYYGWSLDFWERSDPKLKLRQRSHLLAVWGSVSKLDIHQWVRDQGWSPAKSSHLIQRCFQCFKIEFVPIWGENPTHISELQLPASNSRTQEFEEPANGMGCGMRWPHVVQLRQSQVESADSHIPKDQLRLAVLACCARLPGGTSPSCFGIQILK